MYRDLAQDRPKFVLRNKIQEDMRNTEYTAERLSSMISSENSLNALMEMMGEMGLEITEISKNF